MTLSSYPYLTISFGVSIYLDLLEIKGQMGFQNSFPIILINNFEIIFIHLGNEMEVYKEISKNKDLLQEKTLFISCKEHWDYSVNALDNIFGSNQYKIMDWKLLYEKFKSSTPENLFFFLKDLFKTKKGEIK